MKLFIRHLFDPEKANYRQEEGPIKLDNPAVWRIKLEAEKLDYIKEVYAGEKLIYLAKQGQVKGRLEFCLPPVNEHAFLLKIITEDTSNSIKFEINPALLPSPEFSYFFKRWAEPLHQKMLEQTGTGVLDILEIVDLALTIPDEEGTFKDSGVTEQEQREILSLLDQVLQNPNVELVNQDEVVEPGQLNKITTKTVLYFIKHPETWRSRGMLRPKPMRALTEKNIENPDVYENRFVLFFIKRVKDKLKLWIAQIEANIRNYERQINTIKGYAYTGLIHEFGDNTWRLNQIEEARKPLLLTLKRYRNFFESLRAVQAAPFFKEVKDTIKNKPQINQALSYDPRYARLLQLYNRLIREKVSAERAKEVLELTGAEFYRYYQDYCLWMMINAIRDLLFERERERKIVLDDNAEFVNDIELYFSHKIRKDCHFSLRRYSRVAGSAVLAGNIEVVIEVDDQKSRFILIPVLVCWDRANADEAEKEIEEIYKAIKDFRQYRPAEEGVDYLLDSVFLVHPTSIDCLKEGTGYSIARKLSTMGNNFVCAEDWQEFGGYKIGMFPLLPPMESLSGNKWEKPLDHLRLKRLLRIHLLETGAMDHCWQCNRNNFIITQSQRGDEYLCQACKYKWGFRECKQCGNRIIKVITPREDAEEKINPAEPAKFIAEKESMEIKYATSATCEGKLFNPRWAICPYCGSCEKYHADIDCLRCKEVEKDSSKSGKYQKRRNKAKIETS